MTCSALDVQAGSAAVLSPLSSIPGSFIQPPTFALLQARGRHFSLPFHTPQTRRATFQVLSEPFALYFR